MSAPTTRTFVKCSAPKSNLVIIILVVYSVSKGSQIRVSQNVRFACNCLTSTNGITVWSPFKINL